ncbi:EAL domain-containing protein [Kordiimonas aquimaris]|uniref:EAL domain-containing protein n=1 Tax=Kordiimonas aquimaris TaxID=707591 RepID=UPI0021CE89E0|nr:EAL domain-containing protein [Kordiimonas aquimaris]
MASLMDEIKKERERFVAFAFAAAEIFLEIDGQDQIVFEGGAAERLCNDTAKGTLIGTPITDIINADDVEVFLALKSHLVHKGRLGPIPLRFKSETGGNITLRLFALHMPGAHSRTFIALRSAPLGARGNEHRESSETGLIPKDTFLKLASSTMTENPTNNSLYITAVEVDGLDDAKKKHGPKFAERFIRRLAAHLKTISIDGEMAGQIDGKHFAFLHRAQTDGQRIKQSLEELDQDAAIKASVATLSSDTTDLSEEETLRTLSYVLNQFCENTSDVSFDNLSSAYETMASEAQQRVTSIRSMIESASFNIAFQPVISLMDGTIHHHEVLSRFNDKMAENKPLEVIKFAENVGMIEEFDITLCKKAIDYIRKMKRLGDPVSLAINVSGRTLDSDRFRDTFLAVLSGAKDIARSLLIELTETSTIQNMEKAEAALNDLKAMHYRIALDDFGAGASGYQYLRAFNVDFVKIDGTYIRSMGQPNYNPTFLLSIVRLCNDLNIKTIGEHVENQFQADLLKSLGVHFGQGYHFGKPEFSPKA